jgi:transmembrane sensor
MFPKNDIEQLLTKYRKGQLTSDELRYLEEWYLAWKPEKADISAEELEALKQNVWQAVDPDRGRTSGWRYWHSAATILVFLLAGVYYWLNDTHIASLQKPIVQHAKNNALFPGRDRAMLTLSNGQSIDLDQYTSGKVAQEGASIINKTADGQLNYSASGEALKTQPIVYNTLTTPRGGQYHLVLPDGTGVWLNAASSLTFPVQFNKSERVVTLRGL